MGTGWTGAQVDRKIKSLRGHYNTVKRLIKSGSTTGSAGWKKPLWPYYDRLLSFLGSTEYDPQENNIIMQPIEHSSEVEEEDSSFQDSAPDLEMLLTQIRRQDTCSTSTS